MKKLMSAILALVLVFSVAGACFAETSTSSAVKFEPKLADAMKYDADKYMSTSLNRALVTVLLFLQLTGDKVYTTDDYSLIDSMVAEQKGIITVALLGEKNTLVMLYAPGTGVASHMTLSATSKTTIEAILKEGGNTEVYTNSIDDLKTVLEMLKEVLNNK